MGIWGERGFSLIEMMVVVAILSAISLALARLYTPIDKYFMKSRLNQKAALETRVCLETIVRTMSSGRASTCVIKSGVVPFSRAEFRDSNDAQYVIAWSTTPMNSVHLLKTSPGGVTVDSILARSATSLIFGFDPIDPGVVHVTLQVGIPELSNPPGSLILITAPVQTIRMMGS